MSITAYEYALTVNRGWFVYEIDDEGCSAVVWGPAEDPKHAREMAETFAEAEGPTVEVWRDNEARWAPAR